MLLMLNALFFLLLRESMFLLAFPVDEYIRETNECNPIQSIFFPLLIFSRFAVQSLAKSTQFIRFVSPCLTIIWFSSFYYCRILPRIYLTFLFCSGFTSFTFRFVLVTVTAGRKFITTVAVIKYYKRAGSSFWWNI